MPIGGPLQQVVMRRLPLALGYVWCLPLTLLGVLLALAARSAFWGWRGEVPVFVAAPGGWLQRGMDRIGSGAFCFGAFVVIQRAGWVTESMLTHELAHYAQARRWGFIGFPIAFCVAGFWAMARSGQSWRTYQGWYDGWYWLNHFEVAARQAELRRQCPG